MPDGWPYSAAEQIIAARTRRDALTGAAWPIVTGSWEAASLAWRTVRWRALAAVALAVGATACDRDEESQSPDAQVLVAVVRDAAEQAPPREDPDELPVVYVVSSADDGVEPKVQAAVANTLNGEIDVRFADARREAVDDEQPGQPVRDDGCLVRWARWPTDADPVDVEVEFYRSETEFSVRAADVLRVGRRLVGDVVVGARGARRAADDGAARRRRGRAARRRRARPRARPSPRS